MQQSKPGALTKQRGQSVVEVSVLIPVLLLILLGVLDLGRGFFTYVAVANAAREGARYASIHPSVTEDYVRQRVLAETGGALDVGPGGSLLAVERSSASITDTITVTVRYSFTTFFLGPVSGFVASFWGGPSIPNPIRMDSKSVIPISPGNVTADAAAATASAISAATATAMGIPSSTATRSPTVTPTPTTPWITLSSYVAYSAESLTIQGCNFHQNKAVTIFWDGVATWSSNTDNGGCFGPSSFTVPVSVSGSSHTVTAETQSGPNTLSATASPQLQVIATPTATATATSTGTATATGTSTATATATGTATATPIPIVPNLMEEEDEQVTGTAAPSVTIEVRDISADGRPIIGTGTSLADGTFSINVSPDLIADHYIVFSASNGAVAMAIVQRENPTVTPTASVTGSPTTIPTNTATPTSTPPTPEACYGTSIGGSIYEPGGSKESGATVSLIMDGQVINTAVTGGPGTYQFTTNVGGSSLAGNRSYIVRAEKSGYVENWTSAYLPCGQAVSNADVTLSASTPTPTATSTAPSSPVLAGICTNVGANYYHSLSWGAVAGATNYYVYRYNGTLGAWEWNATTSSTSRDVTAAANAIARYYVTAVNAMNVQSYPSNQLMVVCGNTPTPTSTPLATATPTLSPTPFPDLIPFRITWVPESGSIETGQTVTVTLVVRNQGDVPVNGLFWVDLYVDPSLAPTLGQSGSSWQAISSLAANTSVTVTFYTSFSTTGNHLIYVQVDSYGDVVEGVEDNNVSNAQSLWVVAAPTPTVTATPLTTATVTSTPAQSPTPSATASSTPQPGSITGDTYVYANGTWSLQPRVAVEVYVGTNLISSTYSDNEGHYQVTGLTPGTYTVMGTADVNGDPYYDTRLGVAVTAGTNTPEIDLFLFPF